MDAKEHVKVMMRAGIMANEIYKAVEDLIGEKVAIIHSGDGLLIEPGNSLSNQMALCSWHITNNMYNKTLVYVKSAISIDEKSQGFLVSEEE